jgi:hypothetical protein
MEATPQIREALMRIQTEYVEMPQLKLTKRQVQRLWSLPSEVCEAALTVLIREEFLVQSSDGTYVRHRVSRSKIDRIESLVGAS